MSQGAALDVGASRVGDADIVAAASTGTWRDGAQGALCSRRCSKDRLRLSVAAFPRPQGKAGSTRPIRNRTAGDADWEAGFEANAPPSPPAAR